MNCWTWRYRQSRLLAKSSVRGFRCWYTGWRWKLILIWCFFFIYHFTCVPSTDNLSFWLNLFLDILSGDQDSVIPLIGSRTLVHGLAEELGLNSTVPYRVWFAGKQVNSITKSFKVERRCTIFYRWNDREVFRIVFIVQVGGWTQVYGNILSFATIRGASHEAPFSQPERSLVLFKSFLEGRPLPEAFWSTEKPKIEFFSYVKFDFLELNHLHSENSICLLSVCPTQSFQTVES